MLAGHERPWGNPSLEEPQVRAAEGGQAVGRRVCGGPRDSRRRAPLPDPLDTLRQSTEPMPDPSDDTPHLPTRPGSAPTPAPARADVPAPESADAVPASWPLDDGLAPGAPDSASAAHLHAPHDPHPPRVASRSFWRRVVQRRATRRGVFAGTAVALVAAGALVWAVWRVDVPVPVPAAVGPVRSTSPPGQVGFRLTTGRTTTARSVHSLFVMPSEAVPLALAGARSPSVTASAGRLDAVPGDTVAWTWTAPAAPGLVNITIRDAATGDVQRIAAFVMTPYDASRGAIGGYEIGRYVETSDPSRRIPPGFVELPRGLESVPVSPHFTLGEFACKQPGSPRYLTLDERLLVKLETLLVRVRAAGIPASRFVVMSGYRTPAYNASIGNETSLSAHLYGQAADIFIDEDGNGQMDDITGDGQVTRADAERFAEIAAPLDDDPGLVGGLGIYSPAPHRGPFIHIDVRGSRARW